VFSTPVKKGTPPLFSAEKAVSAPLKGMLKILDPLSPQAIFEAIGALALGSFGHLTALSSEFDPMPRSEPVNRPAL
jgi:hypothetical protein